MRRLGEMNPAAVFVYFLCVAGLQMFVLHPVICALSLVGAVLYRLALGGMRLKTHLLFLAVFILASALNPLFNHNGKTVLFLLNNSPVTLEALLYGILSAGSLVAVLYWFSSFSKIMTSDRLLYVFGGISPKFALVVSMALRYIPLFLARMRQTSRAQRALGLYSDDNLIDGARGGARVFGIVLTASLEGGIITADSMEARGYGCGRRSRFSLFRFTAPDALLLCGSLLLCAAATAAVALGALKFEFYPEITAAGASPVSAIGLAAYGLLAFAPAIIEAKEAVKWKYLKSKI